MSKNDRGKVTNLGFIDVEIPMLLAFPWRLPSNIGVVGSLNSSKDGTVRLLLFCAEWQNMPWPSNGLRQVGMREHPGPGRVTFEIGLAPFTPLHGLDGGLKAGVSNAGLAAPSSPLPQR